MKYLILFLISFNLFAATMPNDNYVLGRSSSTSAKGITVNTGDGSDNIGFYVTDTLQYILDGNYLTLGDSTSANDKTIVLDSTSGSSLKWEGSDSYVELRSEKVRLGKDSDNDITLEFGKGGSNPAIKYSSATGKIQFTNDGSLFKDIGSGSGGGSGGINEIANSGFEDGTGTNWSNTGWYFFRINRNKCCLWREICSLWLHQQQDNISKVLTLHFLN